MSELASVVFHQIEARNHVHREGLVRVAHKRIAAPAQACSSFFKSLQNGLVECCRHIRGVPEAISSIHLQQPSGCTIHCQCAAISLWIPGYSHLWCYRVYPGQARDLSRTIRIRFWIEWHSQLDRIWSSTGSRLHGAAWRS